MKKNILLKQGGYEVRCSWNAKKDNPKITATLYNEKGVRAKDYSRKQKTAKSKAEIEYRIQQLVNQFEEELKPKPTYKRNKESSFSGYVDSRISSAFNLLEDSGVLEDEWAKSTIDKYISKFKKFIMPAISPPETFDELKRTELEEKIEQSIKKNAKKGKKTNARKDTQVYLNAGETIYGFMQEIDPSLPDVQLKSSSYRLAALRREMPKHIPISVQIKFEEAVMDLIDVDPILARAIAVFHSGGLRNSEAASIIGRDLIFNTDYTIIDVSTQEIKGKRDSNLKTPASYRKVVLDVWGEFVVKKTTEIIGKNENVEFAPITSERISKKIKELLLQCGISEEYIKIATLDMEQYPDYDDDGRPVTDVTAYILRRNRASIWANYCGLSTEAIDYMLGHKRYNNKDMGFDEKDPSSFAAIAEKIKFTNFHESFKRNNEAVLCVETFNETHLPSNPTIRILNDSNKKIKLKVWFQTKEPGDAIVFSGEGKIVSIKTTSSRHSRRPHTTLVGHVEKED